MRQINLTEEEFKLLNKILASVFKEPPAEELRKKIGNIPYRDNPWAEPKPPPWRKR